MKVKQGIYELVLGVRESTSPGHTAGLISLWIELPNGATIILGGDAGDLTEKIEEEIAPGNCWQKKTDLAMNSIRKLKGLAAEESAQLWPNHDIAFWKMLKQLPEFYE